LKVDKEKDLAIFSLLHGFEELEEAMYDGALYDESPPPLLCDDVPLPFYDIVKYDACDILVFSQ